MKKISNSSVLSIKYEIIMALLFSVRKILEEVIAVAEKEVWVSIEWVRYYFGSKN